MEITSVRFQAFKSLHDVTCELDSFTVITGPNGAGKTNLVDALNFLGEVYAEGLEFAVARGGGFDNLAYRRSRRAKRGIGIRVECRVTAADLSERGNYMLLPGAMDEVPSNFELTYIHAFSFGSVAGKSPSEFAVRDERVEIRYLDRFVLSIERTQDGKRSTRRSQKTLDEFPFLDKLLFPYVRRGGFMADSRLNPVQLISDNYFFSGVFGIIRDSLSLTKVFQISPFQSRLPGTPSPNALLERHGGNLPAAADYIKRNNPAAWIAVEEGMCSVVPGLEGVDVSFTEDRRLALRFRESGVSRSWRAGEVSDGTIQTLALLVALNDPRNPLLIIEEPENSIHPWILRLYLDLCRDRSDKQIVMTSHSPVLLNYVSPQDVRLMSMRQGKSALSRLDDVAGDLRDAVLSGELSIFDFFDSGYLGEAVPRGMTPMEDKSVEDSSGDFS